VRNTDTCVRMAVSKQRDSHHEIDVKHVPDAKVRPQKLDCAHERWLPLRNTNTDTNTNTNTHTYTQTHTHTHKHTNTHIQSSLQPVAHS
jgi:hypothetical protein